MAAAEAEMLAVHESPTRHTTRRFSHADGVTSASATARKIQRTLSAYPAR